LNCLFPVDVGVVTISNLIGLIFYCLANFVVCRIDTIFNSYKRSDDLPISWVDWVINETKSEVKFVVGKVELHEVDGRVGGLASDTLGLGLYNLSQSNCGICKNTNEAS